MAEGPSQTLLIALGSNLGNRLENLCLGIAGLQESGVQLRACSSVFETPPIGYLDQPPFFNMVASGSTDLSPRRVLSIFHALEGRAGRTREFTDGPRTLDLDLLFFSGLILREDGLQVPHPHWKERSFVVQPLMEIEPSHRDPETGWPVDEVARIWPMEPMEIQKVLDPEGFQKALKEWKE